jgi:hypothetical protein
MTDTQEAKQTPEVTVTTQAGGAATATMAADFTKPEVEDKSLLAGKFKTPADLEKAYKELESKLGQAKPQHPAEEAKPETEAEEEAKTEEKTEGEDKPKEGEAEALDEVYAAYGENIGKALKEAGVDPTVAQKEFEETGSLSEETRATYDKLFGKEVVDAYLRGISASRSEQATITETQVQQIKAAVGGDEGFTKLQGWMSSNLTAEELAAYNETLNSGDVARISAAVTSFNSRYQADVGTEGKLLGGKPPSAAPGYASEEEMLRDMAKPEYKKDAAFRSEVSRKIAASPNLMLVR